MSALVPSDRIEAIVGVSRHHSEHWGRAVSAEQTVYILHSVACRDSGIDLRDCAYSIALDNGIGDLSDWVGREDAPVQLSVYDGWLVPTPGTPATTDDHHTCDSLCDPRDPDDHHTCAATYEECSVERPWCECMCHGFSNDEPGDPNPIEGYAPPTQAVEVRPGGE